MKEMVRMKMERDIISNFICYMCVLLNFTLKENVFFALEEMYNWTTDDGLEREEYVLLGYYVLTSFLIIVVEVFSLLYIEQ